MSGHADTIRRVQDFLDAWPRAGTMDERRAYAAALDRVRDRERKQAQTIATLANAIQRWQETVQRQADRIAWLEGEVAGWRIKLAECEERQR